MKSVLDPFFPIPYPVRVPSRVHSGGMARIVGCEWGPNSLKAKGEGWIYLLAFPEGGPAFQASEKELIEWQK